MFQMLQDRADSGFRLTTFFSGRWPYRLANKSHCGLPLAQLYRLVEPATAPACKNQLTLRCYMR